MFLENITLIIGICCSFQIKFNVKNIQFCIFNSVVFDYFSKFLCVDFRLSFVAHFKFLTWTFVIAKSSLVQKYGT